MFHKEVEQVAQAAAGKVRFLKTNPGGYFLASMMAGVFIGLGVLFAFTIASFSDISLTKLVMGMSFACALSFVVMAGAELFTGNNFVMAMGVMKKIVSAGEMLKLWLICFLGNWVGGIFLAWIFSHTGLANDAFLNAIATAASAKVSVPFVSLLLRGALCNMLVCLAVWCSMKMKSEAGKLIMIFWALSLFFTVGFEHSVANMTLLTLDALAPHTAMTAGAYMYNLATVTLGNMLGGVFLVALPYALMGKKE